jgi:uncharacterized membrane protein
MEWLVAFLGVLVLLALILSIVALGASGGAVRIARLEAELAALRGKLDRTLDLIEDMARGIPRGEVAADDAMAPWAADAEAAPASSAAAARPSAAEAAPSEAPAEPPVPVASPAPEPVLAVEPALARAGADAPAAPAAVSLEERFVSRWMVWIGGVALALAGAFLVKLSIDEGWITPPLRIAAGLMLALALVGAGEAAYRRLARGTDESAGDGASYVPGALTAGGVFTGFGSIFAAYKLYGLIGAAPAFGLLAVIAFGAFALALRHGLFMAILGLAGAHAVPLLVANEAPSAWSLFGYVAIVGTAAALLTRQRAWWSLGWLNLGALLLWPLGWFYASWHVADAYPSGLYLLFVAGLYFLTREGAREADDTTWLPGWLGKPMQPANRAALVACLAVAVLALFYVRSYNYAPPALALLAIFAGAALALGRREATLDAAPWIAAVGVAIPIALWHVPSFIERGAPPATLPSEATMIATAVGFGAVFGFGGFAALWRARRPANWAALSVAAPLVLLFIAYAEATSFVRSLLWGGISLGVALAYLGAAEIVARRRAEPGMNASLGAYAVGAVAGIAGAIAFALPQVSLTIALALVVAAIAWVYRRMRLAPLRWVALALVAAVLVRLVLNPAIVNYHIGSTAPLNWLLYGYGVPVAAFLLAAHWFGGDRRDASTLRDPVVVALHVAALLLLTTGLVLELRAVMSDDGRFDHAGYRLAEQAVQQAALLSLGYGVLRLARHVASPVLGWGAIALFALGAGHLALMPMLAANPLFTGAAVGDWPILNLLLLTYALPAALLAAYVREWRRQGTADLAVLAAAAALVAGVAWSLLEMRHAFHGTLLARNEYPLAEQGAQQAVLFAWAYLLLRVARGGSAFARHAAIALFGLAAAHLVMLPLLATNPVLMPPVGESRDVGDWPIVNTLLLLYAVPAGFAAACFAEWRRQGAVDLARTAGVLALGLVLVWLTLEVRHAFHGRELWRGDAGPAEWYAYSAAWLGFGGLLLSLGIWRRSTALRYASLTLVVIATAKIFLFDLAAIAGLYRVLSFLGLGLSLVGIGFFYRLYVFRAGPTAAGAR